MRLIGWAQAGRGVSRDLAFKPGGPLPRLEGVNTAPAPPPAVAPIQAQNSGPIRVPPLTPDRVSQYTTLFETSGAQSGVMSGKLETRRLG